MEENKKSDTGILEKLAMITDATQQLFPDGKSLILFELDDHDFKEVQKYFRKIDINHKKFVIDISGVEVVFILKNSIEEKIEEKIEEPKEKKTSVFKQILNSIFWVRSIPTVKN
jgi:hypothetical protein